MKLITNTKLYLINLMVLIPLSNVFGQTETYGDNFSTRSYARNDGSQNWNGDWIELNDNNSAVGGLIRVTNAGEFRFNSISGIQNVRRTADLSGATSANLSFDWEVERLNGGRALSIQVSNNGGTSYSTIGSISGNGVTSTFNADITAFISANTTIRFLSLGTNWGNNRFAYLDNVFITVTLPSSPEISIDDVTENEDTGNIEFTVSQTGNTTTSDLTIDYAVVNVSTNTSDFNGSTTGTITFPANTLSDQPILIPIFNDNIVEATETFLVNLSNPSETVNFTDNAGAGTIIDDDITFITDTDSPKLTCSTLFVDSGGIGGDYSNDENPGPEYTICPDIAGNFLIADFTVFDVETRGSRNLFYDVLSVYNGADPSAPLYGNFDNFNPAVKLVATNPSGCLTFVFNSDGSVTEDGWEALISCTDKLLIIENITFNENVGTVDFVVTYNGPNTSPFTIDYTTNPNTAIETSDYIPSSGILNFNGTSNEPQTITLNIVDDNVAETDETFFLTLSNISDTSIDFRTETIANIIDETPILVDAPLTLYEEFNGYYDYVSTGASFRDSNTDECSLVTATSNTLTSTIIPGATIEKAYLIWAHSGNDPDQTITFESQQVDADVVHQSTFIGVSYFSLLSDVTDIINNPTIIPNPSTNTYNVTDLAIDNSECGNSLNLGGWSLFIFYTEPSLPAVGINMYHGFQGQQTNTTDYPLDGFFAIEGSGSKTTVLSWEGDIGLANNELLSIETTSTAFTTLNGDGNNDGTPNNPFNSTIFDDTNPDIDNITIFPVNETHYGLDLDTYDISDYISLGDSDATTRVQVGDDFVILNAVILKVPSNLITGTVFEDLNYPGGSGRDLASSSGIGVEGAIVELYDNTDTFVDSDITDTNGAYNLGGMANGNYTIRVVNSSVKSNRGGGSVCTTCLPVQTFRTEYTVDPGNPTNTELFTITNEIGGKFPSGEDSAAAATLGDPLNTSAQTVSTIIIETEGVVGVDFGFNFNTIVNTNEDGQGSLEQFIVNSNALDETGLDIEAHPNDGTLNPAAGEDTSIFMIPISEANGSGYFNILTTSNLSPILDANTKIDGRTQTAYSNNTNMSTIVPTVTNVGTTMVALPTYDSPEIQVQRGISTADAYGFDIRSDNVTVRNIAVFANGNSADAVRITSGSGIVIQSNTIGLNAIGTFEGNTRQGIRINGGSSIITENYISGNRVTGIRTNNSPSTTITLNYITANGTTTCNFGSIGIRGGALVNIQNNLIENGGSFGIMDNNGNITSITENTITASGQNTGCANNAGISLQNSNSSVINNIIHTNAGAGIILTGSSNNLISQNSIYANGTTNEALGIDLGNNGITTNDLGDGDTGPNGLLNFPVFESVTIKGNQLKVVGWSRPGANIELFITDINEGTATAGDNQFGASINQDYGEGQTYIGTITEGVNDNDNTTTLYSDIDGNTDNTNRFNITLNLASPIPVKTMITATATIANTTSEFGSLYTVRSGTVITNRRITYRVKKN